MSVTVPIEHKPFLDFGLHIVFGGVMFVIIFVVALLARAFVFMCESWGLVPVSFTFIMDRYEPLALIIDLIFLTLFTFTEFLKLIRDLWK